MRIGAQYRTLVRTIGAVLDVRAFAKLYFERQADPKIRIPNAIDQLFMEPRTAEEKEVKEMIESFDVAQIAVFDQELFKQRRRLAEARRALEIRPTKKATEEERIATSKIDDLWRKLVQLQRSELLPNDSRIFSGTYAPVLVWEDGHRVIKPMRYQCRPAGKSASYDTRYPGTYVARRGNLESYWKNQFGSSHCILVVDAFHESVNRDGKEVICEFRPRVPQHMFVACLWSRWSEPDQPDLLSFAAITDEPPPEVASAGSNRCIIPIRAEHADAWLKPNQTNLAAQQAILDARGRPYFENRVGE